MNPKIRAFLPPVLLVALMASIFALPAFRQVGSALDISMEDLPPSPAPITLPRSSEPGDVWVLDQQLDSWQLATRSPSQKELDILAGDTRFSNSVCVLPRFEQASLTGQVTYDRADLSIVLSGHDLANSIHRPERCLPAQGHRILSSEQSELELPGARSIPVTRLLTQRSFQVSGGADARWVTQNCIVYYFFVGHEKITASHTERTLIDIRDRVLRGEAQRWAYVTGFIGYVDDENPGWWGPLNREQADRKVRDLLADVAERKIDWDQIRP